jgi:DNA polymerase-4/DNA polymerase V
VEEYSIDECFADLTGLRGRLHMSYPQIAEKIKHDLDTELGMTFSIGVSATKTLAKIGSKWKKPSGLTMIPLRDSAVFLAKTPIESIWGIGPNTSALLNKFGVRTAYDFVKKPEQWVREHVSKPYFETWQELNGIVANELDTIGRKGYQSISKTKTFTPPSTDPQFVFAQLSKNIENACIKARRWNLVSPVVFFFLKTQDFRYQGYEIKLPYPTNVPQDILKEVTIFFPKLFKKGTQYRATGITLAGLAESGDAQMDLFGSVQKSEAIKRVFESVDKISEKFGKHAVFLGSSFGAMTHSAHLGGRGDVASRVSTLFKGETNRRRLAIPMLGEVK